MFDRVFALDWSAANTPKRGADSIWLKETGEAALNLPTRATAMAHLETRLLRALNRGERVLLGCDFVFGYPAGTARALTGSDDWRGLWALIAGLVRDGENNASNRFEVAGELNRRLGTPLFWGHPPGRSYAALAPTRSREAYATLAERRIAETHLKGPQPVWKLTGVGSVGSQTLLGIARLEALRQHPVLGPEIAVWPYETGFAERFPRPITLLELYPSLFPLAPHSGPRDEAQVIAAAARLEALDRAGQLARFLSAPENLAPATLPVLVQEEGWIAGIGHEALLAPHTVDA